MEIATAFGLAMTGMGTRWREWAHDGGDGHTMTGMRTHDRSTSLRDRRPWQSPADLINMQGTITHGSEPCPTRRITAAP